MSTLPADVNAADDHASRASGRSRLVLVLAEDAVQRGRHLVRPLVEVLPHQFGGKRADELARLIAVSVQDEQPDRRA